LGIIPEWVLSKVHISRPTYYIVGGSLECLVAGYDILSQDVKFTINNLPETPILLSTENMKSLNVDIDDILRDDSGGVIAHLEVFRNLACLNLLRQHTYRKEYNYSHLFAFSGSEGEIMARVDSCVQRLRQVLMCAGDATPYLIMLTPEKKQKESPDFNTLHYCRNFDAILDWTRENGVPTSVTMPSLYALTGEMV
jgi:hypothetical protein